MTTLRQTIEPHHERGTLARTEMVSVGDLHRQFRPERHGSTRALILKMFEAVSARKPWAIILCRFKGSPPHPAEPSTEAFYRRLFEPEWDGLVEYWRDASLGAINITGSRVFDWVEVDIARSNAGGWEQSNPKGPGRSGLVDAAIRAVLKSGDHQLDGFFSQIAVYCENWSVDNVPVAQQFAGSPFWIDGSADKRGKVTLTPIHAGDVTAHEMGHGFGMRHDANADATEFYQDPCCIMSQSALFQPPGWTSMFGSAICLPHLIQLDWMYKHRLLRDDGSWRSQSLGATFVLAPINDPSAHANLGIALAVGLPDDEWDYYLEYARPTGWNQGLKNNFLFIRRLRPSKIGPTAAILASLTVPAAAGDRNQLVEPKGNTRFEVQRLGSEGRIIKVIATKL